MINLRTMEVEGHTSPLLAFVGKDDEWDYCFKSSPPRLSTELFKGCHQYIKTELPLSHIKWQGAKNFMRIGGTVVPAVSKDEFIMIVEGEVYD